MHSILFLFSIQNTNKLHCCPMPIYRSASFNVAYRPIWLEYLYSMRLAQPWSYTVWPANKYIYLPVVNDTFRHNICHLIDFHPYRYDYAIGNGDEATGIDAITVIITVSVHAPLIYRMLMVPRISTTDFRHRLVYRLTIMLRQSRNRNQSCYIIPQDKYRTRSKIPTSNDNTPWCMVYSIMTTA